MALKKFTKQSAEIAALRKQLNEMKEKDSRSYGTPQHVQKL